MIIAGGFAAVVLGVVPSPVPVPMMSAGLNVVASSGCGTIDVGLYNEGSLMVEVPWSAPARSGTTWVGPGESVPLSVPASPGDTLVLQSLDGGGVRIDYTGPAGCDDPFLAPGDAATPAGAPAGGPGPVVMLVLGAGLAVVVMALCAAVWGMARRHQPPTH